MKRLSCWIALLLCLTLTACAGLKGGAQGTVETDPANLAGASTLPAATGDNAAQTLPAQTPASDAPVAIPTEPPTEQPTEPPTEPPTELPEPLALRYEMKSLREEYVYTDGTLYYYYECEYPVFSGDTAAVAVLNRHIQETVEACKLADWDNGALVDRELADSGLSLEELWLPYFTLYSVEVGLSDRGLVSLREEPVYYSGGMHPYHYPYGVVFDAQTGAELGLDHFLKADESQRQALAERFYTDTEYLFDGRVASYESFYLTPEGIVLMYWIGDAIPRVEVTIPYTDAEACFADADILLQGGATGA